MDELQANRIMRLVELAVIIAKRENDLTRLLISTGWQDVLNPYIQGCENSIDQIKTRIEFILEDHTIKATNQISE